MSGIEDLKKKSKAQLDEMYDVKPSGKPVTHLPNKSEKHLYSKLDNHTDMQISTLPVNHENIYPDTHIPNKMVNQSNKKLRPCKITFNLPEELYKAFNDLYAMRILQGKKTEV